MAGWTPAVPCGPDSAPEAMALAISNTFSVFGFGRLYFGADYFQKLPNWAGFLGAVQTVLGFALLFLLGLGLRNRFRLK